MDRIGCHARINYLFSTQIKVLKLSNAIQPLLTKGKNSGNPVPRPLAAPAPTLLSALHCHCSVSWFLLFTAYPEHRHSHSLRYQKSMRDFLQLKAKWGRHPSQMVKI